MKKIISLIMVIALSLCSLTAYANEKVMKAYKTRVDSIVYKIEVDEPDGVGVAVIYTPENKIFSATRVFLKDKKADLNLLYPETSFTFKYYPEIGVDRFYSLPCYQVEAIEDIQQVEDETTDGNEDEKFVPVYGDTAAGVNAFAVVIDSKETLNEHNEAVALVRTLYRGLETELVFASSHNLDNLFEGGTTSVLDLKAGDVLDLNANLSGKLYGADIIFRAPTKDVVLDEAESAKLYTTVENKKEYSVFGIVANSDDKTLVLYNKSGLEDQALYLDLDPNTVVYEYDNEARFDNVTTINVGAISNSVVLDSEMDDNENIITWEQDNERVYAYVRVYEDVVCDVILFTNH